MGLQPLGEAGSAIPEEKRRKGRWPWEVATRDYTFKEAVISMFHFSRDLFFFLKRGGAAFSPFLHYRTYLPDGRFRSLITLVSIRPGHSTVTPIGTPMAVISAKKSINSGDDAPLHQLAVAIPILPVLLGTKQVVAPLAVDQQDCEVDGIEIGNGRCEKTRDGP